ncbi:MAG: nitrous oxide reductase accessory protein NosL [Ginsengibacter sp.]
MKKSILPLFIVLLFGMLSCNSGPQPIKLGIDACDFCKMSIAERNFGAEIITNKGKVYKFDDTHCFATFRKKNIDSNIIKHVYFVNFMDPHNFIDATHVFLLKSSELHSPMGGNTAAFENKEALKMAQQKVQGNEITLQELYDTE